MDALEFSTIRKKLNKTQKEMSQILGTSLKTVHSYEQGWRKIPYYVERHLFFLLSLREITKGNRPSCWELRSCSPEVRANCPAYQLGRGKFCWFVNGTICLGRARKSWEQKMKVCQNCEIFTCNIKQFKDKGSN